MSTFNTSVKYNITQEEKGGKLEMGYLYLKNVPVTYAQIHTPSTKMASEDKAYQMNVFMDAETQEKWEDYGVNKQLSQVGVTKLSKGKNRGKIKYPVKTDDGEDTANTPYEGMYATQLTRDTVKRDKKTNEITKTHDPLKVVDSQGNPFTADVGNGSICHVKLFVYKNKEGMLNAQMDTVVVVDHVEYIKSGGSDGYDEEFGFAIKSAAKAPAIDPELSSSEGEAKVAAKSKPAPKAAERDVSNAPPVDIEDDIPFNRFMSGKLSHVV